MPDIDILIKARDQTQQAVNTANKNIGSLGSAVGGIMAGITAAITNMALQSARAIKQELIETLKESVNMFREYDTTISHSAAVVAASMDTNIDGYKRAFDESYKYMGALSEQIALDKTVKFGNLEVADSLYFLVSAGMDVTKMTKDDLLPIMHLAEATDVDLAVATGQVVAGLNMFNFAMGDSSRIADVYTKVIGLSQATMEKLGTSMQFAGSQAASMNVPFEETVAVLSKFYDVGIDASTAGTSLRMAMIKLADPSKEATKYLKEMGLAAEDVDPQVVGLIGAIENLAGGFNKLPEGANKAAIANELFGTRAGAAMMLILDQADSLGELNQALVDSGGTAKTVAELMMSTFGGAMMVLESNIEALKISIGEALVPVILALSDTIQSNIIPVVRDRLVPALESVGRIVQEVSPLFDNMGNSLFTAVKIGLIPFAGQIETMDDLIVPVAKAIYTLSGTIVTLAEMFSETIIVLKTFVEIMNTLPLLASKPKTAINSIRESIDEMNRDISKSRDLWSGSMDDMYNATSLVTGGILDNTNKLSLNKKMIESWGDTIEEQTKNASKYAVDTATDVLNIGLAITGLPGVPREVMGGLKEFNEETKHGTETTMELGKTIVKVYEDGTIAVEDSAKAQKEYAKAVSESVTEVESIADSVGRLTKAFENLMNVDWSIFEDLTDDIPNLKNEFISMTDAVSGFGDMIIKISPELDEMLEDLDDIRDKLAPLIGDLVGAADVVASFTSSIASLNRSFTTLANLVPINIADLEDLEDVMISLSGSAYIVGSAFESTWGQLTLSIEDLMRSFGGVNAEMKLQKNIGSAVNAVLAWYNEEIRDSGITYIQLYEAMKKITIQEAKLFAQTELTSYEMGLLSDAEIIAYKAMREFGCSEVDAWNLARKGTNELDELILSVDYFSNETWTASEALAWLEENTGREQEAIENLIPSFHEYVRGAENMIEGNKRYISIIEKYTEQLQILYNFYQLIIKITEIGIASQEDLRIGMENLILTVQAMAVAFEEYSESLVNAFTGEKGLLYAMKPFINMMEEEGDTIEGALQGFIDLIDLLGLVVIALSDFSMICKESTGSVSEIGTNITSITSILTESVQDIVDIFVILEETLELLPKNIIAQMEAMVNALNMLNTVIDNLSITMEALQGLSEFNVDLTPWNTLSEIIDAMSKVIISIELEGYDEMMAKLAEIPREIIVKVITEGGGEEGSMQTGGPVPETGLYVLHKGENVIPANTPILGSYQAGTLAVAGGGGIAAIISAIVAIVGPAVTAIGGMIIPIITAIGPMITGVVTKLGAFIMPILANFGGMLSGIIPMVGSIFTKLSSGISGLFDKVKGLIGKLDPVFAGMVPNIEKVGEKFYGLAENILPPLYETYQKYFIEGKELPIVTAKLNSAIASLSERLPEGLGQLVYAIWEQVAPIILFIEDEVSEFIGFIKDTIKTTLIDPIIDRVKDMIGIIRSIKDKIFGGIKDAIKDFVGALKILKDALFKTIETIMSVFFTLFSNLLGVTFEKVEPVIPGKEETETMIDQFEMIISKFVELVIMPITRPLQIMEDLINRVSGRLNNLIEILEGLIETIKLMNSPFKILIDTIKGIIDKIKTVFSGFSTDIETDMTDAIDKFKGIIEKITAALSVIPDIVLKPFEFMITFVKGLKTKLDDIIDSIKTKIGNIIESIVTRISDIIGGIKEFITTFIEKIKTHIIDFVEGIITKIQSFVVSIKTVISTVITHIKDFKENITILTQGIITLIKQFLKIPFDVISGVFEAVSALKDRFKLLFEVVEDVVSNITIWERLSESITKISTIMESMVSKIIDFIIKPLETIVTFIEGLKTKLVNTIVGIKAKIEVVIESIVTRIQDLKENFGALINSVKLLIIKFLRIPIDVIIKSIEAVSGIADQIMGVFENIRLPEINIDIWERLSNIITKLSSMIEAGIGKLISIITSPLTMILNIFNRMKELIVRVTEAFGKIKEELSGIKDIFERLKEGIRTIISPIHIFRESIGGMIDVIKGNIGLLVESIKTFPSEAIELLKSMFTSLVSAGQSLVEMMLVIPNWILTIINGIIPVIHGRISGLISTLETIILSPIKRIKGVIDRFVSLIDLISTKIGAVFDSFKTLFDSLKAPLKAIITLFKSMKVILGSVVNMLVEFIRAIPTMVIEKISQALISFADILTGIPMGLADIVDEITTFMTTLSERISAIRDALDPIIDIFKAFGAMILKLPVELIVASIGAIADLLKGILKIPLDILDDIRKFLEEDVLPLVKNFSDLITGLLSLPLNIITKAVDIIVKALGTIIDVWRAFRSLFLIPFTTLLDVISPLINDFKKAIMDLALAPFRQLAKIITDFTGLFEAFFKDLASIFTDWFTLIWKTIFEPFRPIINAIADLAEQITDIFEVFHEIIFPPIEEFLSRMLDMIQGPLTRIAEILERVVSFLTTPLEFLGGIFGFQHGGYVPEDMIAGLHKGEYVIPAHGGSAPINITMNNNISSEVDADAIIDRMFRRIEREMRL